MFSNTVQHAIETTIKEFNHWIHNNLDFTKYTDSDIKGSFLNYLKKNLKGTEFYTHYRLTPWTDPIGFKNIHLSIVEGNILNLNFSSTNDYNETHKKTVIYLNDIVKKLDLTQLKYNVLDTVDVGFGFEKTINQINSFKVK